MIRISAAASDESTVHGPSVPRRLLRRIASACCRLLVAAMPPGCATSASGGVVDFEGSGGGGLTPWALITGLGTNTQIGASADCTYICPQHFFLTSCGAGLGIDNRLELPYAHQTFDLSHLDLADIATHPDQHGLYLALRQLLSGA